jgi:hypothetical protein
MTRSRLSLLLLNLKNRRSGFKTPAPLLSSRPTGANPCTGPGFASILALLLLAGACGTATETIVIEDRAQRVETRQQDDAQAVQIPADSELRVLRIGELNSIRSFDPLFADNPASMRTSLLVYEGLVALDQHERVVPAAADRWEVSLDSLRYTFELREALFFQDDESFSQGVGRRVNANDVSWVFHRMASRDVPSTAAELFLNTIRGFETYYREQREVWFEQDREVDHINGITVEDTYTITFHLNEPDPLFLQKLASPYAAIYPREAFQFRRQGLHHHPVGTGPFRFLSSTGDSLYVFERNGNYNRFDVQDRPLPRLHRVELLNIDNPHRLLHHYIRGRLDMIFDISPGLAHDTFENRVETEVAAWQWIPVQASDALVLRYNTSNRFNLGRSDAASVLRHIDAEGLREYIANPTLEIIDLESRFSQTDIARVFNRFGDTADHEMIFAYSRDALTELASAYISETIDRNLNVQRTQLNVFSRDIFLYLDYNTVVFPGLGIPVAEDEIMRLGVQPHILIKEQIQGVSTNSLSWWIDLRQVHGTRQEHS